MDPERWQRIKGLFNEALERPAAEREAFLGEATGDDPALLEHLRRLLAAHEETSDRLEGGALEAALPALHDELQAPVEGLRIGPYRVISELGRGGMGAVYLAARADGGFEQEVAVKLIKRGMDSDEIVRRFVHERQILASLVHPNIARLLDGGTTAEGRPYFVMEPVLGQPITAYVEAAGLGLESRLRLFLSVAAAVQFAHQSLVVHRDLKPANVLVGADGTPKLLDFGIAKLLAPDGGKQWTALDHQPLTPDYASPEQLDGRPVTTATDVHGLGLLLYELLVGDNPVAVERELGPGWRERPASQTARALGKASGNTALWRRARRLEGDLDTILSKALAADPAARYGTAGEMADDLERHLAHRPVRARRPTLAYRLGRALLRHRLAAAFLLVLVAAGAAMTWQAIEQRRLRQQAETRQTFLVGLFRTADPAANRGAEITAREVLAVGAKLLLQEKIDRPTWLFRELGDLAADPETRVDLLTTIGEVQAGLGLREDAERTLEKALALSSRLAGREARALAARGRTSLAFVLYEGSAYARSRKLYGAALAERERLFGRRSLEAAEALNGLGMVAAAESDPRAREYLEEALAIRRQAGEAGRIGVAETLNNLGFAALNRGELAEAARSFGDSLRLYREVLGEDHPDAVRVLGNLGTVQFQLGDLAHAESTYAKTLVLRRRVLGSDHPDLAITLIGLGAIKVELGELAAAEAFQRQALAMRQRLGLTHDLDYADGLNDLASTLRARGDLPAARSSYSASLALYRELSGAESSDAASALNGLAEVDLDEGDLAAAERRVRQALDIRQQKYGREHRHVARSLHLLGRVLLAASRPAEAKAALLEALAVRRKVRGVEHPDTAETEGELGACYLALGQKAEARAHLEVARRILAAAHGERHPDAREVGALLARLDGPGKPAR